MDFLIFFYVWLFLHQVFAIAEYRYVTWIPRSIKEFQEETKDMSCPTGHVPVIALLCEDNYMCKTILICAEDKLIPDKACLEYNGGKVQARFTAPCENFSITPCTSSYIASKSYELFECFEIYGRVPSPRRSGQLIQQVSKELQQVQKELQQVQKELQQVQKELTSCQSWKKAGTIAISILLFLVAVAFISKLSIVFFVKKFFLKNTTSFKEILQHFRVLVVHTYQEFKKTQSSNDGLNTTGPEGERLIQNTHEQQNNGQEQDTIKDQAPECLTGQENKSVTSPKDIDVRRNKQNIHSGSLVVYNM